MKPIRVCHVMTADLWAGAEVQLATTLSYLATRDDFAPMAVLFNEGRLADELRRVGVDVGVVDERVNGPAAIVRFLVRYLVSRRVDIVHTHRYKDTVLGAIAARRAGVPRVVRTVHGLAEPMSFWPRTKFRAFDLLSRGILRLAGDRVIAVSRTLADALARSGYCSTALTTIHNGIDLSQVKSARSVLEVRRELNVPPGALLIGTAGRLTAVKGHRDLLAAVALLRGKGLDARCLIAGAGPLQQALAADAEKLDLGDASIFTGARDDVHDLIAAMDVFVLPSLHEGIPMALLEAMALERPVVATRVGGIPEVVDAGATGLLVPPRDPRALAAACLELASDRARARELGARARRAVEARFSHVRSGEALAQLYESLAHEARRPPALGLVSLCTALPRAVASASWRRCRCARERRRMLKVRRDPSRLAARLASARRILIVCHGNIIRSPFAAALVSRALGPGAAVSIASAGLDAVPGRPAHSFAVRTADARRVDLRGHAATPLTRDLVAGSDIVFVMDLLQLATMRARFPEAVEKTYLLTCLSPGAPLEVRDPVDGDPPVFQACYDHIAGAVRPIVRALTASACPTWTAQWSGQ